MPSIGLLLGDPALLLLPVHGVTVTLERSPLNLGLLDGVARSGECLLLASEDTLDLGAETNGVLSQLNTLISEDRLRVFPTPVIIRDMANVDSLLATLTTRLAETDKRVRDTEGLPASVDLQRRRVEHISLVVGSADRLLVSDDAAKALDTALGAWVAALSSDETTAGLGQSEAASGAALSALPPYGIATPTPASIGPFLSTIENASTSAATVKAELTGLQEKVDRVSQAINTVETRVQESVVTIQAQLQQGVDDTVADFESKSAAIKSQTEDSLTLARQQHETLRDEQKRLFEESLGQAKDDAAADRKRDAATAADLVASQKAAGDAAINALQEQLAEAVDLMGAIGRTGQSVAYGEDATVEGEQAEKWRRNTIWFAVAAAAVLLVSVLLRPVAEWLNLSDVVAVDDYRFLISRVLLAGTLGGLAAYSGRQASMHRRTSRKARNRELALASIGAYLQPLEKIKREQVLEVFAFLFFAQADEEKGDSNGDSPVVSAQLLNLLQQVRNNDG